MRIEVEVFKEVDGVDMVIRFFEVELLCGKCHRGLHGSHNSPLFIGLLVANIVASVCFAKRRAKNFIYNGLSQRHPARASPSQCALAQPPKPTAGAHSRGRMSACLVLCHRVCRHVAHRVERLAHQRTVCIGGTRTRSRLGQCCVGQGFERRHVGGVERALHRHDGFE